MSACQASDGTYTLTIRYDAASSAAHIDSWLDHDKFGTYECSGNISGPEIDVRTGLPSGTKVVADIDVLDEYFGTEESLKGGPKHPRCGEKSGGAKPLLDMWLLTDGGKYCILVSENSPVGRSPEGVVLPRGRMGPEQVLCNGILYDNDFWECDAHGKAGLHVDDLMKYHPRHKAVIGKDKPRPASQQSATWAPRIPLGHGPARVRRGNSCPDAPIPTEVATQTPERRLFS